jgi:tetratricopeptide (TPR) repeat protein
MNQKIKPSSKITARLLPALATVVLAPQMALAEKSPSKYLDQAETHYKQGELVAAIQDLNQAIEVNPDHAAAYYSRGKVRQKQAKFEAAIQNYNQAIEINPDYTLAYVNRGLTHRLQGNLETAIADLEKAKYLFQDQGRIKSKKYQTLQINLAKVYYEQGVNTAKNGNLDKALTSYTKAIKLNPNDAKAYNNRGFTYFQQENWQKAIQNYTQAIEINPDFALAYANRGLAYREKGNLDKAINNLEKAADLYREQGENKNHQNVQQLLNKLQ